ncbi:4F5 protein related disordered region [Microdochium nivale]|nr:4F5 protein related disordered region [Microdochium nivale]
MGNGARAAQKRDRNAKDTKVAKSQLKTVRTHPPPSSCHLSSRNAGSSKPIVARTLPPGFSPRLAVAWVLAHVLLRDSDLWLTFYSCETEREGHGHPVPDLQVDLPQDHPRSSVCYLSIPPLNFPRLFAATSCAWRWCAARRVAHNNSRSTAWRSVNVFRSAFTDPCLSSSASRLTEHAVNKHSKAIADCFPNYEVA